MNIRCALTFQWVKSYHGTVGCSVHFDMIPWFAYLGCLATCYRYYLILCMNGREKLHMLVPDSLLSRYTLYGTLKLTKSLAQRKQHNTHIYSNKICRLSGSDIHCKCIKNSIPFCQIVHFPWFQLSTLAPKFHQQHIIIISFDMYSFRLGTIYIHI